jgi:antitoxin component YwqK of YwqJK toxin-antitoxin module
MTIEVRTGFSSNGSVKYEKLFLNDKPWGTWKFYFEDGKIQEEVNYDDQGLMDGVWKVWYPNGTLFIESYFKNGERNGMTREWYDNGKIQHESNYENGEIKGVARNWSEKGTLLSEKFYNGIKNDTSFD